MPPALRCCKRECRGPDASAITESQAALVPAFPPSLSLSLSAYSYCIISILVLYYTAMSLLYYGHLVPAVYHRAVAIRQDCEGAIEGGGARRETRIVCRSAIIALVTHVMARRSANATRPVSLSATDNAILPSSPLFPTPSRSRIAAVIANGDVDTPESRINEINLDTRVDKRVNAERDDEKQRNWTGRARERENSARKPPVRRPFINLCSRLRFPQLLSLLFRGIARGMFQHRRNAERCARRRMHPANVQFPRPQPLVCDPRRAAPRK